MLRESSDTEFSPTAGSEDHDPRHQEESVSPQGRYTQRHSHTGEMSDDKDQGAGAMEVVTSSGPENGTAHSHSHVLQHNDGNNIETTVVVEKHTKQRGLKKPSKKSLKELNDSKEAFQESYSLDLSYLHSFPGMLMLAILLLAVICYICCLSSYGGGLTATGGKPENAWTEMLTWTTSATAFFFILAHVAFPHVLEDPRNAKGLLFIEMVCAGLWALTYLITGCVMAGFASKLKQNQWLLTYVSSAHVAAAAIGSLCAFLIMGIAGFTAILYFAKWSGIDPFKGKVGNKNTKEKRTTKKKEDLPPPV